MTKRGGDPTLIDFVERARLASLEHAPEPAVLAAALERDARMIRAQHLEAADPAITDDDIMHMIADTLAPHPPLEAARTFLASDAYLLILYGDLGVGKSVAAAWCVAQRGGEFVAAMDVASIFDRYDAAKRKEQILTCRTLVVDDCGLELNPERFAPCLTEIINRRRSRGRRTILTSNMGPAGFQKRYPDPRLWDRVRQAITPGQKGFTGPSLRGSK